VHLMVKCRAKTKTGRACKAAAVGKTGRCLFHSASNAPKNRGRRNFVRSGRR
jgi:hypothetical protein